MSEYKKHLMLSGSLIKNALLQLNELAQDAIIFIVDKDDKLIGSLTDGDIRRGFIKGLTMDSIIDTVINQYPKYIIKGENNIKKIIEFREDNYRIIPVLDKKHLVVNVINFRKIKSYLPIDAVIMAGGRGERLKPLTNNIPKPLLYVGDKPIMEHNLDRLILYGIDDFWFSINYFGEQIENYFGTGIKKNI